MMNETAKGGNKNPGFPIRSGMTNNVHPFCLPRVASGRSRVIPAKAGIQNITLINVSLRKESSREKHSARPQNLWVVDIRLACFRSINRAIMDLFYRDLFRSDIFQVFFPP